MIYQFACSCSKPLRDQAAVDRHMDTVVNPDNHAVGSFVAAPHRVAGPERLPYGCSCGRSYATPARLKDHRTLWGPRHRPTLVAIAS